MFLTHVKEIFCEPFEHTRSVSEGGGGKDTGKKGGEELGDRKSPVANVYMCLHIYVHIHVHTYVHNTYMYIYIYVYIYIYRGPRVVR